jgi:PAS domain S-box-containing protein
MKPCKAPYITDAYGEISTLIETLHQTEQRLEELTAGEVDTVTDRDGRMLLLRRAQEHLRNSEAAKQAARYRGLLEAAPDAMVVVNQEGEIVLLNVQAEKQFGYHRDELVGQKVKNIIPEGFAERLVADGLRSAVDALAQQIGTGIELTGRRKDGSDFPIEIMLSPPESVEGIVVTVAIRDITERKKAESNLAGQFAELSRWHNITSGREGRILELKHEVNELLAQSGQPPRYPSAES